MAEISATGFVHFVAGIAVLWPRAIAILADNFLKHHITKIGVKTGPQTRQGSYLAGKTL